jgi:acetyl/propionyl-CoA carboxylase alpha subunit
MKLKLAGAPREFKVDLLERDGGVVRVRIDGEVFTANIELAKGALSRVHDGPVHATAAQLRDSILVAVGPQHFDFVAADAGGRRRSRGLTAHEIVAPMPGKVLKVLAAEGETVESGAPLIVLEAMKMETTLSAESSALIGKMYAIEGDMVDHGAVLIELKPLPPASDPSPTGSAPPDH